MNRSKWVIVTGGWKEQWVVIKTSRHNISFISPLNQRSAFTSCGSRKFAKANCPSFWQRGWPSSLQNEFSESNLCLDALCPAPQLKYDQQTNRLILLLILAGCLRRQHFTEKHHTVASPTGTFNRQHCLFLWAWSTATALSPLFFSPLAILRGHRNTPDRATQIRV